MPEPSSVATTDTLSTSPFAIVEPAAGSGDPNAGGVVSGTAKLVLPSARLPAASTADHDSVCAP